jgi:hypothetical protein
MKAFRVDGGQWVEQGKNRCIGDCRLRRGQNALGVCLSQEGKSTICLFCRDFDVQQK